MGHPQKESKGKIKSLRHPPMKPKLEIYIGSILLKPADILPAKARESTVDRSVYDIVSKNSGDATATKGVLRIVVWGKGTGFKVILVLPESTKRTIAKCIHF